MSLQIRIEKGYLTYNKKVRAPGEILWISGPFESVVRKGVAALNKVFGGEIEVTVLADGNDHKSTKESAKAKQKAKLAMVEEAEDPDNDEEEVAGDEEDSDEEEEDESGEEGLQVAGMSLSELRKMVVSRGIKKVAGVAAEKASKSLLLEFINEGGLKNAVLPNRKKG